MSELVVHDLHVTVGNGDDTTEILKGVDLTVRSGETHAIMGPNGSGKSTLAYSIAGHPKYTVVGGTVTLDGEDVLAMTVDQRARAGLFLAMQYPVEVPGVSVSNFLRTAATAVRGEAPKLRTWIKEVNTAMTELGMDKAFAERSVNEGFSGGEKKRHEILQLELLKPKIAILDETDSGLDVDALRVVSEGVNKVRETGVGTLLITHYTRILRYISPDQVHVFFDGRIVESGGPELADVLESDGYARFGKGRVGGLIIMSLDVEAVRKDFPILAREIHGHPLVYLDSANSAQKPQVVIDAESEFYARHYANVARAVHTLGSEATSAFEGARDKVAEFLNAPSRDEIVFTANITAALNLLAYSFSNANTFLGAERFRIGPGDEIVVTEMEHHSNLVPWQLLAQRTGATFRYIPIDEDGRLVESAIDEVINERTKVVSFVHQSNALGTINPVKRIVARAKAVGAYSIIDAAQSAPHLPLDVQDLGADFVAFTGHKLYGPSGVGVLWGRYELLKDMPPFLGGGEMIETVTMAGSTYAEPPHRFEAGTPMIAQAVALGTAVDYVTGLGRADIREHEQAITTYALAGLQTVSGLRIIGPREPVERGATISFVLDGVHPHDVAQLLDEQGIAVRAGHHCARPVCVRYGVPATTRASFGIYTTTEEIDALVRGVEQIKQVFA